jgi:hypothetical protein
MENDENIAFSINFNDLILDTVLKGLKILKVLNDFRLAELLNLVIKLEITIRKSNLFQLSRK